MKEIIFVTHNKGKIALAERHLKDVKFSTFDYELDEPRSDDVKEIAKSKVMQAYELVKKPCIALDSGFYIESLNGFPRAFVNFALDTIGIDGILKLMENKEDKKCSFKECVAYYDGEKIEYFFGESKGNIAEKISGNDSDKKWSDLWYIFKPQGFDITLADMTDEQRVERRKVDKSTSSIEEFAKWYKCK